LGCRIPYGFRKKKHKTFLTTFKAGNQLLGRASRPYHSDKHEDAVQVQIQHVQANCQTVARSARVLLLVPISEQAPPASRNAFLRRGNLPTDPWTAKILRASVRLSSSMHYFKMRSAGAQWEQCYVGAPGEAGVQERAGKARREDKGLAAPAQGAARGEELCGGLCGTSTVTCASTAGTQLKARAVPARHPLGCS
jgi:hypothetical protein